MSLELHLNCCKLGKAEISTVPPSLGELVPQLIAVTTALFVSSPMAFVVPKVLFRLTPLVRGVVVPSPQFTVMALVNVELNPVMTFPAVDERSVQNWLSNPNICELIKKLMPVFRLKRL
jgi:hypothetical protein